MCGLLGALLDEPRLTDEQVAGALGRIAHRGPDHTAWRFSKGRRAVLGHVRLSIIGLANGDQPLVNEAGDVHCVVNGELYGHRAIRAELAAEGRPFVTDSDSEIALHLYEKLGGDFVHRLRGEFAVVILDERRRCLIAVRDRFGIKPLYYAVLGGSAYVASEIKALPALGVPARWDADAFFAEAHTVRGADRTLGGRGCRRVPRRAGRRCGRAAGCGRRGRLLSQRRHRLLRGARSGPAAARPAHPRVHHHLRPHPGSRFSRPGSAGSRRR